MTDLDGIDTFHYYLVYARRLRAGKHRRAAFFVQLPIVFISIGLVFAKVNIKLPAKLAQSQTLSEKVAGIDWGGAVTLVAFLSSLLIALGLKSLQELPWTNLWVAGLLATSVVFLGVFVLIEKDSAKEPILPIRLIFKRNPFFVAIATL
jgi:protein-S-isoprenylcysteine O-methyltransferase Ste14